MRRRTFLWGTPEGFFRAWTKLLTPGSRTWGLMVPRGPRSLVRGGGALRAPGSRTWGLLVLRGPRSFVRGTSEFPCARNSRLTLVAVPKGTFRNEALSKSRSLTAFSGPPVAPVFVITTFVGVGMETQHTSPASRGRKGRTRTQTLMLFDPPVTIAADDWAGITEPRGEEPGGKEIVLGSVKGGGEVLVCRSPKLIMDRPLTDFF